MMDVFGWLEAGQWLALLRIAVGFWWVKSFFHKPWRRFVGGQMVRWSVALADNHPVPAYGRLIRRTVEPNAAWFPYLILAGEASTGIALVAGFLTPIAALAGIFMNLNYLTLAGARPKDLSVNPAYQCEQGQNLMMIAAQVVILMLAAGSAWSLDAALGLFS